MRVYGHVRPRLSLRRRFGAHPVFAMASSLAFQVDHGVSSPKIFDQGNVGSCDPHSVAAGIATALALKGRPLGWVPSPDCLYRLGRSAMRAAGEFEGPLTDTGTDPFYMMQALAQFGVSPMGPLVEGRYSDCSQATIGKELSLFELLHDARNLMVGAWEITSTGDQRVTDIRTALNAGLPVGNGFDADQALEDWTPDKTPLGAPDQANILGGHATLFNGYDWSDSVKPYFIVRNSWGESYGAGGRFYASPEWVNAPGMGSLYVFDVLPGSY